MMTTGSIIDFDGLQAMLAKPGAARRLVAIAGAPGSGKSTVTDALVSHLNASRPGVAAVLPMDGYHYDDRVLDERGLRARKGAPDTFDVAGFRHVLGRLRADDEGEVAVPVFDRDLEISRAAARILPRAVRVVLVEGNYLLLDSKPWRDLHPFFDATVMVDVPVEILRQRLTARWEVYGLPAEEIRRRVEENDLPNGFLVTGQSVAADHVLRG